MSADDDVTRLLVRVVLDPAFRDLVRRAPDEAFRGLDLTDADKETLRVGDAGMLRLLATALGGGVLGSPSAVVPNPPATAPVPAPAVAAPAPVPLSPIALHLLIQPYAQQTPEGLRVTCAVSVQPVPAATAQSAAPPAPPSPPAAWTAWDHDLDSTATRAATAAVRSAAPAERGARIAELLRTMTSREHIGGPDAHGSG